MMIRKNPLYLYPLLSLLIVSIWVLSFPILSLATANHPPLKGFQEWKAEKIQTSQIQMSQLKTQMQKASSEGNKKTADALEKQLDQSKWNLEVVQDLSVTDYFVLYLSQHPNPERFQLAAAKMSTKEVALLMEAYAKTLNPVPKEAVIRPTQQAAVPPRLPLHAIQNRGQLK